MQAGCQGNFDQKLEREAADYTAEHCPQRVDEGTVLRQVSYDRDKRVYTFHYQLSPAYASALSTHQAALRLAIVKQLRNDVDYQKLKDEGVIFSYEYRSEADGRLTYRTEVRPAEYR